MSLITVAGLPLLAGRLTLPPVGRWVLSADLDGDTPPEGAVEVAQGNVRLVGAVHAAAAVAGTVRIVAVGGSGGLARELPARSYQGVTARAIVEDLLAAAGERLDAASTRDVLSVTLPYWTRAGGRDGRAGASLTRLAEHLNARWRVLPAGSVWVGRDTWPATPDEYRALELDRDGASRWVLLAPDDIGLFPGVSFRGERVGRVEHVVTRDGPLRTTYWIDS